MTHFRGLGAPFATFVALVIYAATIALATPAYAQIEIQWWHAMTGGNNQVIVQLLRSSTPRRRIQSRSELQGQLS